MGRIRETGNFEKKPGQSQLPLLLDRAAEENALACDGNLSVAI
jgi:hypothetical protein